MAVSKAILFALSVVGQSARFKQSVGQSAQFKRSNLVMIAGIKVHRYKPNNKEWVIMFDSSASDSTIDQVCNGKCSYHGHPSEKGVAFATVHGSEAELEELLQGASLVDHVETDDQFEIIPEIEKHRTQAVASWGLERIGATSRPSTGKGVHIYVQDSGVRTSHREFGGRAATAFDISDGKAKECWNRPLCAADTNGHGSHCAGTAAGATFGVAPDAKIYAVKTMKGTDGQRSWQYAGIDYVSYKGKRPAVLSMSLSGEGEGDADYDDAFAVAVNAGVVTVVAAGNNNAQSCHFTPAFSKNVITVGATDSNNRRADYTNYGKCNDIWAPGSAIVSVDIGDDSSSTELSGTSMACPHVSGAAALLLEKDPSLDKAAVLETLKAKGLKNFVKGAFTTDPVHFLWVGTGAPPSFEAVTPEPAPRACRRRWSRGRRRWAWC